MTTALLLRAQGDPSPLYTAAGEGLTAAVEAFVRNVPLEDPAPALPADLADRLARWSVARPPGGFASRPELRRHAAAGLEAARSLAVHLGPAWSVRYWDERHRTAKFVCWGCRRLHWSLYPHGVPPHPLHIVVEGEYQWHPLRAEGFEDFAPDDPAAGLGLSDDLVADLYRWSADIDAAMELYLRERDEDEDDARRRELDRRGRDLTERVARELGPGRTAAYGGLA